MNELTFFPLIPLYIFISLFVKAFFAVGYVKYDLAAYHEIKELKIDRGIYVGWFWRLLFWRISNIRLLGFTFFKHGAFPLYRISQKIILMGYWFLIYQYFLYQFPIQIIAIELFSVLWAYYFMTYEFLYYRLGGMDAELSVYQYENIDPYWLTHWFFSGKWLFVKKKIVYIPDAGEKMYDYGFRRWKFEVSAIIGLLGMAVGSFVYLIK